jgi:hypothetical protein
MAGAGTHLHAIFKEWFHQDYRPGCGCREIVQHMDKKGPVWCRDHVKMIAGKIRAEIKNRGWWGRVAVLIPGVRRPIKWIVLEAIRRAEADGA